MVIVSFKDTRVDPMVTKLKEKQQALQDKIKKLLRRCKVGHVLSSGEDDEENKGSSSSGSVERPSHLHKRKEISHIRQQKTRRTPPYHPCAPPPPPSPPPLTPPSGQGNEEAMGKQRAADVREKSYSHTRRRNNDLIIYEKGSRRDDPPRMQEPKKLVLSRISGMKSNQCHLRWGAEGVNRVQPYSKSFLEEGMDL